ncbi:flagellar protein FliT [Brenneria tiliae]|uniref:flagellar protein FliT n=1 Tax=Brenneria tiliae TaxID=2914984 RepID=UPI002014FC40|nr:flagellar protein FliT [Brenneria tiliae]MCL2899842.1 flagellar protein FliT [Brenneria tiliae]MCL2904669.1 flagellar protein FliT [Brenneria tiliae]
MNASEAILSLYQQLLTLSNECLLLAKKAEWDKLIDFSHRYIITVEKLSHLNDNSAIELSTDEQQKIKISLQRILNNEQEVKKLLQARMSDLKGLMSVSTQQHSVNSAYNKFADRQSMLPGKISEE